MAQLGSMSWAKKGRQGLPPLSPGLLARARELDSEALDPLYCSGMFLFYILVFMFRFIRQDTAPFLHGSANSEGPRGLRMVPPVPA